MRLYEFLLITDLSKISTFVGILGVFFVLICYFLLQIGTMSLRSFSFSFYNFLGSTFLLFSLSFHWNLSSVMIEIAWFFISLYGMVRALKEAKKNR